jgi:hypothetical protein
MSNFRKKLKRTKLKRTKLTRKNKELREELKITKKTLEVCDIIFIATQALLVNKKPTEKQSTSDVHEFGKITDEPGRLYPQSGRFKPPYSLPPLSK